MKKQTQPIPTGSKYSILHQLCNLIPLNLVPKLARETGVAQQERTFSTWSQAVALMFSNAATSSFVLNNNYVLFSGLTPVGGTIAGSIFDVTGSASSFNGFQLVEVIPEPASLSLLAVGRLLLFRRRKME